MSRQPFPCQPRHTPPPLLILEPDKPFRATPPTSQNFPYLTRRPMPRRANPVHNPPDAPALLGPDQTPSDKSCPPSPIRRTSPPLTNPHPDNPDPYDKPALDKPNPTNQP